jgi:pyruvate kinase
MILSGMEVARLNFSHGDYNEHKLKSDIVKKVRAELGSHTALLLDTKGPEIRLKRFKNKTVNLTAGSVFSLCMADVEGDETKVSISYPLLYKDIYHGCKIMLDDGLIELSVEKYDENEIVCRVINGGPVSDHKNINIPNVSVTMPFLSDKDKEDIAFAVRENYDFIAASFTQSAGDIKQIRHELDLNKCPSMDIRIIAKIENSIGVKNIDEIISEADGIMVARGDLGVEIPLEDVPVAQKTLISKCYKAGKQVITATQMLESMTKQPRPTRAETNDVANAIYDGTSAIMLSGETASGLYPVEAVETMARIAERIESDIDYKQRFSDISTKSANHSVADAISHATVTTAHDLSASAIITITKSGLTAFAISRYRPDAPIIGCSPELKACRHMNMAWGVIPVHINYMESTDELIKHTIESSAKLNIVDHGDLVVLTAGIPLGISGTTNMLKVEIVGDVLTTGTPLGKESVCGTLCVCMNEKEAVENCKDGDILVIPNASNKIIGTLRKCKGIICEKDGLDSYVATVGEILEIPVIVGAAGVTKILKSGTSATLDIKRGVVFSGN